MRYRYPKINNWLVFKKTVSGKYEVTDGRFGDSYLISGKLARFAMRLDGQSDPYTVSPYLSEQEVREFIRLLDSAEMLRYSRFLSVSLKGIYLTLWTASKHVKHDIFSSLNKLLISVFLPVFIIGIMTFFNRMPDLNGSGGIVSSVAGLLIGVSFHEIAHALACAAYDGLVFEIGLNLSPILPGAYVMMNDKPVKNPMKRAQISAAGIEANLLIAGICFLLAVFSHGNSYAFFNIAAINAELAAINLLLVDGLDGAGVMSEILGIDSLGNTIRRYLQSMWNLIRGKSVHRPDTVYSAIGFSAALIQPVYVILLILNVWVVYSWI